MSEEHNEDYHLQDNRSFWDLPPEELNWFGRILHRIRDFIFGKE